MKCPACLSENSRIEKENYYSFQMLICNDCGCEFCNPFKAPDLDFYANANDNESSRRHNVISNWHKTHPTWNSKLLKNGSGLNLLDIGCGNGDFAEFADSNGFNVIGIDIDKSSLKIAQSRGLKNAKFINTTLVEFIKTNSLCFDFISMFEVFEHVDNPNETINLISQLLKPGGYFVGSLPNENRYLAKKVNLKFALPPYHLTYWTTKAWSTYLVKFHNFRLISINNNAYYGYISNIFYQKNLETLNIKTGTLADFFLKCFWFSIKKIEILFEKLTRNASSFYFEFKK
jgi:2-polyprenyl-3-methyl-5-hydroxy-6-metoxy-1,4-benzoquinol methylase